MQAAHRSFAVALLAAACSWQVAAQQTLDRIEILSRLPFAPGGAHSGVHFADAWQAFSADGRYVAWNSTASALIAGVTDLNGAGDVFLKDLQTGVLTLVSHREGDPSRAVDGASSRPLLSADGRYLAFGSTAEDLVGGPSSRDQVYLYDRVAGTLQLVTHTAGGSGPSNRSNTLLAMSADGRYLAIESDANDLIAGVTDPSFTMDIYLWDRQSDSFQLVTHQHDAATTAAPTGASTLGYYGGAQMSPDGRYLAFPSTSGALIPGDGSTFPKIFLFDRVTGANSLVSRTPAGGAVFAEFVTDLAPDGRFALFSTDRSASQMITGATDSGNDFDLFLFDRTTNVIELISRATGAGVVGGNDLSFQGWLSDDGQSVYFTSYATNLVSGITDGVNTLDLFLRDRSAGATSLLSRSASAPTVSVPVDFDEGFATGDGASFSFSSNSPALVAGMTGSGPFAFRYDRPAGQFTLLSHTPGSPTVGQEARMLSMAADGESYLWQLRDATPLTGAPDPQRDGADLAAHDRIAGSTQLLNVAAFGGFEAGRTGSRGTARLSDNGRVIAFTTASRLCAPDQTLSSSQLRACLLDRISGELSLLSHEWDDPGDATTATYTQMLEFSSDGGRLLLQGLETTMAPDDDNGECDLFLYDRQSRTYELISRRFASPGTTTDGESCQAFANEIGGFGNDLYRPLLSDDATRVVFASSGRDLMPGTPEAGFTYDVYLRDRATSTTVRLSSAAGSSQPANGESHLPEISGDGRYATFFSSATDLIAGAVDGNGGRDLFLFDLNAGTRTLVSRSAGSPLQSGNGLLHSQALLSTDGSFVAFTSLASNHVAGATDANNSSDVFLFDRATGANTLVSHAAGQPLVAANNTAYLQDLSRDGRFVLFLSNASDVVAGVRGQQLYRWDRSDGSVRLVSHVFAIPAVGIGATWGQFLGGGDKVVFTSASTTTIPGLVDRNEERDLFLWDAATSTIALLSPRLAEPVRTGNRRSPYVEMPRVDLAGNLVLFSSSASDLVAHDGNTVNEDYFLAVLDLFGDGFESGDTSGWTSTQP
jgi:Tol biopolymer transport system component